MTTAMMIFSIGSYNARIPRPSRRPQPHSNDFDCDTTFTRTLPPRRGADDVREQLEASLPLRWQRQPQSCRQAHRVRQEEEKTSVDDSPVQQGCYEMPICIVDAMLAMILPARRRRYTRQSRRQSCRPHNVAYDKELLLVAAARHYSPTSREMPRPRDD